MIKVAFCVAYDWYYLKHSLPLVYEDADAICIALDKDRISWTGNPFPFDEEGFRALIREVDVAHKIQIFEEDFHLPQLKPMENEVRQRNMIAEFMGKNEGWHLQIDSDEYFLNFKGFAAYLKKLKPARNLNVCCPWITLYKQVEEGFLMVKPERFDQIEFIPIATNAPHYEHGRRNGYFNHYTDFAILHQSWARSKEEVWQKLNNWGHRFDSDINAYFKLWDQASVTNYKAYRNFNLSTPEIWPCLDLLQIGKGESIVDLIKEGIALPSPIRKRDLALKNSILYSRVCSVFSSLFGKS